MPKPNDWKFLHIGFEDDDANINGQRIWGHEWRPTNEKVRLTHPAYSNQIHNFEVYEIGSLERPVRFAVSELSNGVWGFYVQP